MPNGLSQFTEEVGDIDFAGTAASVRPSMPIPRHVPLAAVVWRHFAQYEGLPVRGGQNPQFTVGQLMGGGNTVPLFVTPDGPVREARFKSDGGVHDLFTIAGRSDALGCNMGQPDFAAEYANGNLIFRIPTPVLRRWPDREHFGRHDPSQPRRFGQQAVGNFRRAEPQRQLMGIDHSLWVEGAKQIADHFAGEAYNVEMGVTSELFPTERGYPPESDSARLPAQPDALKIAPSLRPRLRIGEPSSGTSTRSRNFMCFL